jgi:hypothetical protein
VDTAEMPDRLAESLILFVQQNHGSLPKGRRSHECAKLTGDEVAALESATREAFERFEETGIVSE